MRVLYTAVLIILGLGYLFALIYLFHTYSGQDGNARLALLRGHRHRATPAAAKGSRLESALRGPMSTMLPANELDTIIAMGAGRRRSHQVRDRRSGRSSTSAA